jgi:hypothetical protein
MSAAKSGSDESELHRIIEIVLHKVGMGEPKLVTLGNARASGHHRFVDITVDGNQPLVCTEHIGEAVRSWCFQNAQSTILFHVCRYKLGIVRQTEQGDIIEICFHLEGL